MELEVLAHHASARWSPSHVSRKFAGMILDRSKGQGLDITGFRISAGLNSAMITHRYWKRGEMTIMCPKLIKSSLVADI